MTRLPAAAHRARTARPARPARTTVVAALAAAAFAVSTALPAPAAAAEVGWRTTTVAPAAGDTDPTTVALWYPTTAPARTTPMGPFEVRAAIGSPPAERFEGLVLVSHGTGGSELGHARLAEALARRGWLVAALRHPQDNWQDASLLERSPARYFEVRPRQASRVLDALLADPAIGPRIATDAGGPRVAAVGHSAGGYTVLALAGGRPALARIAAHCAANAAEDPIFCRTGRRVSSAPGDASSGRDAAAGTAAVPAAPPTSPPDLADRRVRAAVALAPVTVVLDEASLGAVRIPVAIHVPALDRWLVPRFHGERAAAAIPGAVLASVPNAWHFAFLDTPSMSIPSPDGDLRADPPGFDRAAYIQGLGPRIADFLDAAMARTATPAAAR